MGAVEILQTLLERGVSPYLVDKYGRTALHLASWMGEHRCVQILASFHKKYMQNNPLEDIEVNTRYQDFTTADVNYVINEGKECLDSKEHNCLQLENFVSRDETLCYCCDYFVL